MTQKITTESQLSKFNNAFDVLIENYVNSRPPTIADVAYRVAAGKFCGLITGHVIERHHLDADITKTEIEEMMSSLQQNARFLGGDDKALPIYAALLANVAERAQEAFDIAVSDRPLPNYERNPSSEGKGWKL